MEMLIPLATTAMQGIRGLTPKEARKTGSGEFPIQIDSCFAYGRQRDVVKMLWPEHYRPEESKEGRE
jgi:hypothetical protein